MSDSTRTNRLIRLLTGVALLAMVVAYFSPIWWVSLTAPNYPKDAFPDGIRIHFHVDGVHNGCKAAVAGSRLANETLQEDMSADTGRYNPILERNKDVNKNATGLDCVHEMNTINHYVGMFPISTGAPVEKPLAKFFFGLFAVMLVAFATLQKKAAMAILGVGFAAIAVWMVVDQWVLGHLASHVAAYVDEAGTFFKEPEKIQGWGRNVTTITTVVVAVTIVLMAVFLLGVWKWRGFELLLPLVPAVLPVAFVIEYAAWLWFFGHNLHPWGAFTVKPFMPTVFGEGKVAQFSTFSYPHYGFALLAVTAACLVLATLLRRKQLREAAATGGAA